MHHDEVIVIARYFHIKFNNIVNPGNLESIDPQGAIDKVTLSCFMFALQLENYLAMLQSYIANMKHVSYMILLNKRIIRKCIVKIYIQFI